MCWKVCFAVSLLLFLLHPATSQGEQLTPGSGSGIGSGVTGTPDPPTCDAYSVTLDVSLFESIIQNLQKELNCVVLEEGYEVLFRSLEVGLELLESTKSAIFGDYFENDDGIKSFLLEVCTYDILATADDLSCSEEMVSVSLTISSYSERLLPFAGEFVNGVIKNADDRAAAVFVPNPIPFWDHYYTSVYMSTNGVVSFGRPFTQYWPVAFPYGWSSVPIIAPYWNDLDFRNNIEDSGLYYSTYVSSGPKRDQAFLQEFSERISAYTDDGTIFNPTWMLVCTWYKVTPYYGRSNKDEALTFQVLLASDSVNTYAVFLYQEGGINWNRDSRDIVIGYDSKDYVNYLNVDGSESFTEMDSVIGNTGNAGEWYFQLVDPDSDFDPDKECFKWVGRQKKNTFEDYFEGLTSCPCTWSQARRDWRFWFWWRWGLSSGPNCATLVWSRRQGTVECCYDDSSGALLVGGRTGGSYKLHHPLFSNRNYINEDKQPFENCCQSSRLCSVFYTFRPSDDCSGYSPPEIGFTWGDPHFQTVDGLTYTFNGYGEYVLLQSDANNLTVQTRLVGVDMNSTGTVYSAVVVVQGRVQPVQVELSEGSVFAYVNGTPVDIPSEEDEGLIITESTMYTSLMEFSGDEHNSMSSEYISLTSSDENIIISTSTGASVMVSSSSSALHLAVEVNDAFVNSTKGLLGYLNEDASDDFYRPDGTILSRNSSERDIFDYGKLWHVGEEMSKFEYFDGHSYSTYNDGWDEHTPTFTDELDTSILDDLDAVCEGNTQCIFDYAITNNASFAAATYAVSTENEDTQNILNNTPPTIDGPSVVYVTRGKRFEETFTVYDADDHNITAFELVQSGDLSLDFSGDTALLVWDTPGSELPQTPIHILANDSMGAATLHAVSIVLCACVNNGTCNNDTAPMFDSTNGHYLQECLCEELFSGDFCENDDRGCSDDSCPESAVCVEDTSVDVGYNCSSCQDGYELALDGKCTDINECDTEEHGCMHICNNTEGSYKCLCEDGYELAENGRNCTDTDECYEGTDDCRSEQKCINTVGSYECDCYYPLTLSSEGTCTAGLCNGCQMSSCAQVGDQGFCLCLTIGKYCVGDCNGTVVGVNNIIQVGEHSCEDCMPNRYGYRCKRVCDCENGDCDPVKGCVCDAGYTGNHCESEINEAGPEFVNDTIKALRLSWNLPEGAVLAQFNATDMDVGPPGELNYHLYHGHQLPVNVSSGEGIFSIDNETGVLVLAQDLNTTRGLYKRFVLVVVASDSGRNPQSSEVTVSVTLEGTPAPIPSFDKGLYMVEISENVPGNSIVLNFSCTEPEDATGTSNLTTRLTESNDSKLFSLDGEYDDLMLVLLEQRDYEALRDTTEPHYTLEVTCSNQYEITASATIEIEVLNEDDNSFEFDNATYIAVVPENVQRYHHVLTVSAFDPDIPDGIIIYDVSSPPTKFSIRPNGTVYVTESVDREKQDKYILNIEAMLSSSREVTEAVVNITISDINEGPPIFSNDLYTSDNLTTANTVGDVALAVAAFDSDFEINGSVVYSIEENALFAINNLSGVVYIKNASVVSLYGSYVLKVYATDEGNPPMSSTSRVDIYVAPIPDDIEFQDIPSTIRIHEDQPRGYEIESIVAVVVDRNGGVIVDAQTVGDVQYELMPANGSENFHIGRYSGNLILLNSLDFEEVKSYNLTIVASIPNYANATIESTASIEMSVVDVNDNSPVFTPSFYTEVVEEFTRVGRSVLTVHADDADSGNNADVSYRLKDGEDVVPFSIDRVNGVINVTSALDTPLDYRFYVVAEDNGTPRRSSETVVFISVVRSLSVVPEFDRQQYVFNVTENSPPGTEIGSVLAHVAGNNSIDGYTHLKYRLQDASMFHIDPDLGSLSVLSALDAEHQTVYIIHAEVYNDTYVFDNATIEVHVDDVNDHAPQFRQSLYTDVITTARPQHSVLFNVSADDDDELGSRNSRVQYTIAESETIGFGINHTTGAVYIVNSTLYAGDYHLTAVATDEGDPRMSGTVLVFISVIPASPQSILFEESEYTFEVSEDAAPETSVGRVVALDHNRMPFPEGGDLRYRFSDANLTDFVHLTVGPMTGDVLVSSSLDRESQSSYTLVVIAEYEGNQTGEVIMTVNVLDINDNPPIFTKDVYAKGIVTTYGNSTAILQVTAFDIDDDLNGTVQYSFSDGESQTDQFRITKTGEIHSLTETIPAGDYRLIITASDSNPTMPENSTAIVSICVFYQRPNEHLQITTTVFQIPENSPAGTEVGTVQLVAGGMVIVPEHYSENLEFSIGEDYFVINESNGTLKLVGALDRELRGSYSFEVTAGFSEYNIHVTITLTVEVVDENDNRPVFNPILYSTIIDDGYADNQRVPTDEILVTDRDEGRNAQLDISLDEVNPFGIHLISNTTGELRGEIIVQNASLLEPEKAYIFNIIASDGGNPPETAMATVRIQVEYAIPDMIYFPYTHYAFNHTENSPTATEVGRVSVLPDTPALDDLVYSVSGGSGIFVFHIHQYTGVISNHFPLDREQGDEFNLTITAQLIHHPISSLSATTSVTVTVLDTNDNVPIFDRSSYSAVVYVDELVTDVPVVSVSASDADIGENSVIIYSIVDPSDSFDIIRENGSIFAISTSLGVRTYSLTVEATDMGDDPLNGSTIVIIDIRQGIPDSIAFSEAQYHFNVSEYDISGTTMGEVALNPPLTTEFVQYRSFSSNSQDFVVVTQSGVVQSRRRFDYESSETVIDFEVTCTLYLPHENGVTLTDTASVRVNVLDENDNAPEFINFPRNIEYRENVTQKENITRIFANDADSGTNAELVFSIANNPLLRIDPSTGDVFVSPGLDREEQEVHTVSVLVTDRGSVPKSYQDDFTLTLLDINDNIPVLVETEFSVDERVSGSGVFQLQYRDSDEQEYGRATIHIPPGQSGNRFTVDSASGEVTLNEALDFEVEQSVELVVELVDNPNEPSNSNRVQYTVIVNVLNKPDNPPEFDTDTVQTLVIDPGITQGDTLIRVGATDKDDDDGIMFTFDYTNASFIEINPDTGEISFTESTVLVPGADYSVGVRATDNSEYELFSTIELHITIDARSLTFENEVYASSIPEDTPMNHNVNQLRIQELAQSSDYVYSFTYEIISPQGVTDPFRLETDQYQIDILVNAVLNREAVPFYILQVSATRYPMSHPEMVESLTVNFTITIEDVNDNTPVIPPPRPLYYVSEADAINTVVTQVVATDSDIGSNKALQYSIINPPTRPFEINRNDGTVTIRQQLDFESQETYTLTVEVEDLGTPPLSSTAQYKIQIQNVNDVPPAFAAPAYFGELYTRAPANSDVIHVLLDVSDLDGDTDFTFSISPDPSDTGAGEYSLGVRSQPPYHVIANRIPSNAQSGLRKFTVEVSDHVHKNSTVLYLGVFAQEHLLPMTVSGQSKEDFLTVVSDVLRTLNTQLSSAFGRPVSYYYESIDESSTDTKVLIVSVYGWYGGYGTRYDNGREETRDLSNSVSYVTYSEVEEGAITSAVSAAGMIAGFEISVGDVPVSSPTAEPPTAAAADNTLLVGIISGAVVAVLLIILLIVVISVFGRRRKPKPEKDMYSDLSYKRKRHAKRPESFSLTQKGTNSDLAYETMFDDDDDMLNQEQTIPWFDPNYLAPNENEDYDGDGEQSSFKGGPLRATVDGDARRPPRKASTEKAAERGSVMELDRTKYLDSYQQSTPMQPGQRMGEYDMFLNRNAPEAERSHRPSLDNMAGINTHSTPVHANSRPAQANSRATPPAYVNSQTTSPVHVNSRSAAPGGVNSRGRAANSRSAGVNSRGRAANSRSAGVNSRGIAANSRGIPRQ